MPDPSWLGRLGNLNVSRSQARGPAPHKPLMLLTVMDLVEAGEIGADGWGFWSRMGGLAARDGLDLLNRRSRLN